MLSSTWKAPSVHRQVLTQRGFAARNEEPGDGRYPTPTLDMNEAQCAVQFLVAQRQQKTIVAIAFYRLAQA
jgi:hypothetical protein